MLVQWLDFIIDVCCVTFTDEVPGYLVPLNCHVMMGSGSPDASHCSSILRPSPTPWSRGAIVILGGTENNKMLLLFFKKINFLLLKKTSPWKCLLIEVEVVVLRGYIHYKCSAPTCTCTCTCIQDASLSSNYARWSKLIEWRHHTLYVDAYFFRIAADDIHSCTNICSLFVHL